MKTRDTLEVQKVIVLVAKKPTVDGVDVALRAVITIEIMIHYFFSTSRWGKKKTYTERVW
jgi:hypothetical protein